MVVTRYFGGIKLGAGGLIRAYGSTASLAIKTTGIVKRQLNRELSVTVDYPLLGKVENALRQSKYLLKDILYMENVEFLVYVEVDQVNAFKEWLIDLTNAQAVIEERDVTYVETEVESTHEGS